MKARDPNVAKLELIANALGPLREQVVFVGGCAVGLLITDEAAASVRATMDREYLKMCCRELLQTPNFSDYLPGLIAPGDDQADRAQLVEERLLAIARAAR